MVYNAKYDLAYKLISDILSQQDILLSINSGGGSIAEARMEEGLPFRIKDKWATIGDEERPFTLIWMKLRKLDLLKKQDHLIKGKVTAYNFLTPTVIC